MRLQPLGNPRYAAKLFPQAPIDKEECSKRHEYNDQRAGVVGDTRDGMYFGRQPRFEIQYGFGAAGRRRVLRFRSLPGYRSRRRQRVQAATPLGANTLAENMIRPAFAGRDPQSQLRHG